MEVKFEKQYLNCTLGDNMFIILIKIHNCLEINYGPSELSLGHDKLIK